MQCRLQAAGMGLCVCVCWVRVRACASVRLIEIGDCCAVVLGRGALRLFCWVGMRWIGPRGVYSVAVAVPMRWLRLMGCASLSPHSSSVVFTSFSLFLARHAEGKGFGRQSTQRPTAELGRYRVEQSIVEQITRLDGCDPWDEPCRLQMHVPLVMRLHAKVQLE
jgi:hypothetical protein